MSFLPKDYKAPSGSSDFMKLEEGVNRFRIMSEAEIGWEGWKDNKPFRRKGAEQNITPDEVDTDEKYGKPKISHFWAFKVFDFADKKVKILEITQKTVMKAIESLVNDEDWGDPVNYDIAIERSKNGERTVYTTKPFPPKKITGEMQDALDASTADLEALFKDEEDGFGDFKGHIAKSPKGGKKK